jgi:tRNA pseudouridine38-40 synthase
MLRLILEYDGTNFSGWQVQPNQRTIQQELHKALETILRQSLPLPIASGRTDAGVSAKRQVVTLELGEGKGSLDETSPDLHRRILVGVSSILKNEVSVLSVEVVSDTFHPIRDAVRKQYSYTVWNHPAPPVLMYGRSMHVVAPLNRDRMYEESRALIGEHDFSSFRASGCGAKSPIRELEEIGIEKSGSTVQFRFVGRGFLKQMVRNLVGTLTEIGKEGGESLGTCKEILEKRSRMAAGPTAEPWGLTLDWVEYPEGRL